MRISPDSARLPRHLTRLSLAFMVLLLAASCHSTQVAYQFRPAASLPVATMAAPDSSAVKITVAATHPGVAAMPPELVRAKPRQMRQARQLRRVVAQAVAQQRIPAVASRSGAAQSTQHVARPQQPAEVGLGTTVFGVLGLIVLPVSLLGLLIWGGPVWAILAGLAALAVLIAYIDPFG